MTKIDVYYKSSFERLDLTFNIEWDGNKVIKTTMNRPNMSPGNVTTFTYNGDQLVKSHSTYYDRDNGEKESDVLYEYADGKICKITFPDELLPVPIDLTWRGNNVASESAMNTTICEKFYDNKKNPLYLPMGVISIYTLNGDFGGNVNSELGYLLFQTLNGEGWIYVPSCWSENNNVKTTVHSGKEHIKEYIYDGDYPTSMSQSYILEDGKGTKTLTIKYYYSD